MKSISALALALSVTATSTFAASSSKDEHVGDLICTVGEQTPKAGMLCVFRNKTTGLEETYEGQLSKAGGGSATGGKTMIWAVNANAKIDMKPGVLAQRYEPPEIEQKTTKFIEGADKPGVSLNLVTDKNDDLKALVTLTLDLKLMAAPT
jgi:hypothetical protein